MTGWRQSVGENKAGAGGAGAGQSLGNPGRGNEAYPRYLDAEQGALQSRLAHTLSIGLAKKFI